MKKKRWLVPLVVVIGIGAVSPAYVRVYRVSGYSDAPTFLVGDRILVNKAAYDIRFPYTQMIMVTRSEPKRGDVVMFRPPGEEYVVFKRVIGCPGDTVIMRDGRVEVNGKVLGYEPVDKAELQSFEESNHLGTVIERETGNGSPHLITRTPSPGPDASVEPVRVEGDRYFVVGDNRDNSRDSRDYGSVPRDSIFGKVVRGHRTDP
jgi:signal peptidase I